MTARAWTSPCWQRCRPVCTRAGRRTDGGEGLLPILHGPKLVVQLVAVTASMHASGLKPDTAGRAGVRTKGGEALLHVVRGPKLAAEELVVLLVALKPGDHAAVLQLPLLLGPCPAAAHPPAQSLNLKAHSSVLIL